MSTAVPATAPNTAMVMAAGLGTRMRPLTDDRPKPLVAIAGTTLIDHVLDHLRAAGVRRVVVNVHYFADMLEAHLARVAGDLEIVVSDERAQLMETGGGLVQALPLLDDAPFLCINSDNWWTDGPANALRSLWAHWDDATMDALLLMVPTGRAHHHRGRGDFFLGADGQVTGRPQRGEPAPMVWTGIQILHPRLIRDHPEGAFSTNLFWNRALAAGRLWGQVLEGQWFDVGTPAAIGATERAVGHG